MPRRRTGNIQDRKSSFRVRYYDADGIRHQESYPTREEAERQLAIRLGEAAAGLPVSSKPNTVLFGELCDDVVTDYEVNGYTSVDDIEARFRLHIVPVFGQRRASQITTAQIRKYIQRRQQEGAANGTINRELEAIRHAFLLAKEGRKLLYSPHVPMLREDNVRTGFFTREEVERLTSFLPEPLAQMVWFAFLTGWRLEECRRLEWRAVDFTRQEIRLDPGRTKNREGRVFPMSAELRALLTSLSRAGAVMKDTDRTTPIDVKPNPVPAQLTPARSQWLRVFVVGDFRKSWKTACYKAGIPCTVVPVRKGGKKGAVRVIACSRTFHDLRRSAAKNLIAQGIPERVVMQISGWLTRSVFDRYSIVGQADLIAAREKMDTAHGSTQKGQPSPSKGPQFG